MTYLNHETDEELFKDIADTIHKHKHAKSIQRDTRAEMIKLMVECGCDQEYAINSNQADWLDGYLVANGIIQQYRKGE